MPTTSSSTAISIRDLRKSFKDRRGGLVEAVRGISLQVGQGEIFGFLGPNGAGKTTTLRMLTTLLPADSGEATVAGCDLLRRPAEVRRHIGYVGQLGGTDAGATGRENLVLSGRMYGMSRARACARADELIEIFGLQAVAPRMARTYSGGQKRRLEVALGMMHSPAVLFLDEPTTGLDPQNRANLWEQIKALQRGGTTVFLTTHYLDEADILCERICIMDHGGIVAEGSPRELKRQISGDVVTLKFKRGPADARTLFDGKPYIHESKLEGGALILYVEDGAGALPLIFQTLEAADMPPESISLAQPSLDDVFLKQTGRLLRDGGEREGN